MGYSVRELIIRAGNNNENDSYIQETRKKFDDIWRIFGIDTYRPELKEKKFKYNDDDVAFFRKLFNDYNDPLWKKYFRRNIFSPSYVIIDNEKVSLVEALEEIISGLINCYQRANVTDKDKWVFREVLYFTTHYRKLKFEENFYKMIGDFPELDMSVVINDRSYSVMHSYESWLEETTKGVGSYLQNQYIKWNDIIDRLIKEDGDQMERNNSNSLISSFIMESAKSDFLDNLEEIDAQCRKVVEEYWENGKPLKENYYDSLNKAFEERKEESRYKEAVKKALDETNPVSIEILKGNTKI